MKGEGESRMGASRRFAVVVLLLLGGMSAAATAAGEPVAGFYRSGFEASLFYPEGGGEPWWLEADGVARQRLEAFRRGEGRGAGVNAYVELDGEIERGGRHGHLGGYDTVIRVRDVREIDPIPAEHFMARVAGCKAARGEAMAGFEGDVAAGRRYEHALGKDLTFVLAPSRDGWNIQVTGQNGADLAVLTPPLALDTNPRRIAGWHFRNADNTGPNKGDVNAPQDNRVFFFSPDAPALLAEHGRNVPPQAVEAASRFGQGRVTVLDYGLADLAAGERARMVYLKFRGCATWRKTEAEPRVPAWVRQMARAHGLPDAFDFSDRLEPAFLQADLYGDGKDEVVVPVVRIADGKHGLAVVRKAGGEPRVIGLEGDMGRHLTPAYFDRMDWWGIHEPGPAGQGVAEGAPPVLAGEGIVLGMEEKSSVLVYWDGTRFTSYWQGD
jgi:hypothetical protein